MKVMQLVEVADLNRCERAEEAISAIEEAVSEYGAGAPPASVVERILEILDEYREGETQ